MVLQLSDYKDYSMEKFVEVEGTSSILADSNFPFFIYNASQSILFCLVLYLLFYLIRNYSVSKYIRKFYFIKTILVISILEENLSYFVFVCFENLSQAFSFHIADKFSLIFTVLFLFSLVIFCLCFYLGVFRYLDKQAGYFAEFTYRESAGFLYKTLQILIRNFLRGMAFCFFHEQYKNQLIALCLVEITMITITIALQAAYKIFISKTMLSLNLFYYFLFLLLNLTLVM